MFAWLKALWSATPPAEPVILPPIESFRVSMPEPEPGDVEKGIVRVDIALHPFTRMHSRHCDLGGYGVCVEGCETDDAFRGRVKAAIAVQEK